MREQAANIAINRSEDSGQMFRHRIRGLAHRNLHSRLYSILSENYQSNKPRSFSRGSWADLIVARFALAHELANRLRKTAAPSGGTAGRFARMTPSRRGIPRKPLTLVLCTFRAYLSVTRCSPYILF